jgi:hypothetical protein
MNIDLKDNRPEGFYRKGDKSINSCFCIKAEMENLNYLMHRYNGNYFRNRYPIITLID